MAAPVLTMTDNQDNPLPVLNFGVVDAGNSTGGYPIHIWNNQQAANNISDAVNTTITTKTLNGFDNGDSIQNGNEVVTFNMINVECVSIGETQYSPIGGPLVHSIGESAPVGNAPLKISGTGSYANLLLKAVIPNTASPGNVNFLLRVNYQFA